MRRTYRHPDENGIPLAPDAGSPAPTQRDDRFLGRLAGIVQLLFACLIGVLATALGDEPDFVPRGIVLFVTFGVPGLIGIVGARRRQRALLVAAAVTSFLGSFVAFSGVTLIFLVPAMLFAVGALAIHPAPDEDRRALTHAVRAGAAVAIVVLSIAAGVAALLVTDAGCWNAYPAPLGTTYQLLPFSNSLSVPPGALSSGCTTGLVSARGVGIATVLWICAVWLALRSSRRAAAS
jgi:hypothetical protein